MSINGYKAVTFYHNLADFATHWEEFPRYFLRFSGKKPGFSGKNGVLARGRSGFFPGKIDKGAGLGDN